MLLEVGGYRFKNFDVRVEDVSYNPTFDYLRRPMTIQETWQLSGRLVYGYSAIGNNAQVAMTSAINSMRQQLLGFLRPSVTLYHDDEATVSAFRMNANDFIEGPEIAPLNFPANENAVYSASAPFRFTIAGTRLGTLSNTGILEFNETLQNTSGGTIYGHVGGAIGFAEKQIFTQNEPWGYVQQGRAVGLFGYPVPPGPIYPSSRTKPRRVTLVSPRRFNVVPLEFEIQWTDEYESHVPLPPAEPHVLI